MSLRMRVLILHNRYRQSGGEDSVVQAETELLQSRGVKVLTKIVENPAPDAGTATCIGLRAPWSSKSYDQVRSMCETFRPDIAHVHNFWMVLSPSVHAACHHGGAATVQTLHNPRLLCLNALFLREGRPCEDCLGKLPWRGVWHRCYRNSFAASAAVGAMVVANRLRRTWDRDVDAFITLSQYARQRFVTGGFPPERLFVKPNFIEDPGSISSPPSASDAIVFLGRLSKEKGLTTLLSAWAQGGLSKCGRLIIVGDGPERRALQKQALDLELSPPSVFFTGWKSVANARQILRDARAMVLPSLVHEGFPMTVAEALSFARPVITSRLDGLLEILPSDTLSAGAGNATELAGIMQRVLTTPDLVDRLGENARRFYLANYTPDLNYQALMKIYAFAVAQRAQAMPSPIKDVKEAADARV